MPQTLISFVSGAWADRYAKKMLIIVSDTVIALATLALALLFPLIREDANVMLALLVVSAIRSIGSGVQLPAVNATTPMLVPRNNFV